MQRKQLRQNTAHLGALDNGVDEPVLERELGGLEPFRQLLLDGVADDALPGKPDERAGFGQNDVACMANDAVTPPVVGSVSTVMKGRWAAPRRSTAQDTFAICISETSPSCMRAPPDAQNTMTGRRSAMARSIIAATFSPTACPIEPMKKPDSMTPMAKGSPAMVARPVRTASSSPLFARWSAIFSG